MKKGNEIDVLNRLAKFSDIKIVGNVWSHMIQHVYVNKHQFSKVFDLQIAVMDAWEYLDL